MTEEAADEDHYARVIVRRGDTRPVRERIFALLEPGQDTSNLRTPASLKHVDRGFKERYSPSGSRVHVRPGSADEIVLYWSILRVHDTVGVRPLASPEGAVHPGLVAELMYVTGNLEGFESLIASSTDAFDYVMGLVHGYRGTSIVDSMQALARVSRAKQAAMSILKEIADDANKD